MIDIGWNLAEIVFVIVLLSSVTLFVVEIICVQVDLTKAWIAGGSGWWPGLFGVFIATTCWLLVKVTK